MHAVQGVKDRDEKFKEDIATKEQKEVAYTTAQGKMVPTAVPGDVRVDEDVDIAQVAEGDLAQATSECASSHPVSACPCA